jgi:dTDP-4-dehydrorhamnose reductase
MKILVIGSTGMAGSMIVKYLSSKNYSVCTAGRYGSTYYLDIKENTSVVRLSKILLDFDYVINCTGILVKESANNPDDAILVNSWFPRYLESVLKDTTVRIIHLSTDCVFSGNRGKYTENDFPDETNMYGRSKALGEINNDKDVTFRMSIIGPELKPGTGLFTWITNNMNTELPGWSNHLWSGMTTLQLAKCIDQYIKNPCHAGVYHLVNNDLCISKYDLLELINQIFQCNKKIIPCNAEKSVNKVLITSNPVFYNIPDYKTQLSELKTVMYLGDNNSQSRGI